MFTVNLIFANNVLATTGMTQQQLDQVISGIEQAAALWSRYIDGNNAVIDLQLGFSDLSGSTLAQAGSSFYSQNGGPTQSEVINELNGQSGMFAQDGTFTVDLPNLLNNRFFFSDSLDFVENPGAFGQIDFLTLATHELGHVLGFLGISFEGFVVNNQFIGANAVAANDGNPVQLADGVHTTGNDLLSPSISQNLREPLNAVHIAILQDLGVPINQATADADTLYGFNQSSDTLNGLGGNDILNGLSGNDDLFGGIGNDQLDGGAGSDDLFGGAGIDRALYGSAKTGVIADLILSDRNTGDAAGDTYNSIELLFGSRFNDELRGTQTNNVIAGKAGNDLLFGRSGNDDLFGGIGNDQLDGGAGSDDLFGGAGIDMFNFNLGNGNDHDVIRDFENDIDTINLISFSFSNVSEALDLANDVGSGVVFDFSSGDTLTILNTSIAELTNDILI